MPEVVAKEEQQPIEVFRSAAHDPSRTVEELVLLVDDLLDLLEDAMGDVARLEGELTVWRGAHRWLNPARDDPSVR